MRGREKQEAIYSIYFAEWMAQHRQGDMVKESILLRATMGRK